MTCLLVCKWGPPPPPKGFLPDTALHHFMLSARQLLKVGLILGRLLWKKRQGCFWLRWNSAGSQTYVRVTFRVVYSGWMVTLERRLLLLPVVVWLKWLNSLLSFPSLRGSNHKKPQWPLGTCTGRTALSDEELVFWFAFPKNWCHGSISIIL